MTAPDWGTERATQSTRCQKIAVKIQSFQVCRRNAVAIIVLVSLTLLKFLSALQPLQLVSIVSAKGELPLATRRKLGVVNYVDNTYELNGYLWGIYSIRNQLKKFGMLDHGVAQVVLLSDQVPQDKKEVLESWLGQDYVRTVDPNFIRDKIADGIWRQVFSKIEAFNLTDFDKLIVLDNDILIRQSLLHWFDLPTPAATHTGTIEWNSGAMVITPSFKIYQQLLQYIPKTRRWDKDTITNRTAEDPWNSGYHDQGFLASFFTSNVTNETMHSMSSTASILSSRLVQSDVSYFVRHRPHVIETVHFTVDKPWREITAPNDFSVCKMLKEWQESVMGAVEAGLDPFPADYLRNCNATLGAMGDQ